MKIKYKLKVIGSHTFQEKLLILTSISIFNFSGMAVSSEIPLAGDTFRSSKASTKNYGKAATLDIIEGQSKAFLSFDLSSGIPDTASSISKATLRVFVSTNKPSSGTIPSLVVSGSEATVDESQIAGLALGDIIQTKTITLNNWVTFDVTDYVSTHLTSSYINFALSGVNGLNIKVDSKENKATSHSPVLDVVWINNEVNLPGNNTASGEGALTGNTTGTDNTATGYAGLTKNTTGNRNTANGSGALGKNTIGSDNTANGYAALLQNTSGLNNTANGRGTLLSNTIGSNNTAEGINSLTLNTVGNFNTSLGSFSLPNNISGDNNTGVGTFAMLQNTSGSDNVGIGYNALASNTLGEYNTAIGNNALFGNIEGNNNTAVGYLTGGSMNGNNNTALGYLATTGVGINNATALGASAFADTSNKVRIGNNSVTAIEGQVALTVSSDKRHKNHIQDLSVGLDFIKKIHPVQYIRVNNITQTEEWGVIAQELQQTLNDFGYKNTGIISHGSTTEKYLTVRYNDLLAPMIKAIQEQDKVIQEQQKSISILMKKVEDIEKNNIK